MNAPALVSDPGAAASADETLAARVWADAAGAAALLAVDAQGLGGAVLRAGAGPVRERWTQDFRTLLPAAAPWRRMPCGIADERLLGGLDLGATLRLGRPVAQRGLLAESDGGLVVVAMAERLPAAAAARLCAALDSGEVGFERDGIGQRWPARIGVLALDEGVAEDAPVAAALADRLAFAIDLRALGLRDCAVRGAEAAAVQAARMLLPEVTMPDALLRALCGTALQLGVNSPRATLLALRAARAAAALAGRRSVSEDDALLAARLVLAPRATRLPTHEEPAPEDAPPPEPPADTAAREGKPPPDPPPPADPAAQALEDRIVDATVAAVPAGLLDLLSGPAGGRQSGRVGALSASPRSGRPVGTRRGKPGGGARLDLIETLRSAAPWQRLRRAASPQRARRVLVELDDLRIRRLQHRAATATIFVIDASGSSALHRLAEAKGAVNLLLADCYVRRDQVAVIAFRGRGAELLLPPTRSLVRAKRSLAALPGGGGTPLAAALEVALKLALGVRRAGATPVVVLLTDGRANIARDGEPGRARAEQDALAMASQLRAARLNTLLVDTSTQPAPAAQKLALALGATYRALPHAGAAALKAAVQSLPLSAV